MSYSDIGRSVDSFVKVFIVLVVVFVPLGIWKVVDIVIWLLENVSISIGSAP